MRTLIRPWRSLATAVGGSPASTASITQPLGRKCHGIAARGHHPLKGTMVRGVERPGLTQAVPRRMRRIEMRAGNPDLGHRFGGGMGSAAFQEPRQHVRVRSLRALARGRRDRLIDLDAAEPADEDTVRIGCEDHSHGGIAGLEHRAADMFAQPRCEIAIADADAEIRLQRAETEIEQNGSAIFLAWRLMIGADLGQRDALVHGAIIFGRQSATL